MSGGFSRDKKDDKDSGFGWKLLGAAAAAGVMAAAAYGAKKLYDYMEEKEEKEKEAAEKDCAKSGKWNDEYYQESFKKLEIEDGKKPSPPSEGSTNSSFPKQTQLQRLLSESEVPLQTKLQEYYNGYVNIPVKEMERAQDVLCHIKRPILKYLQDIHPNIITELRDCGSTKEGLKVIKPDEFDVMIPLNVTPQSFSLEPAGSAPGFVVLRKGDCEMFSLDKYLSQEEEGEQKYLSPQKLRTHFQSYIRKSINSITDYKVTSGPKGPSITLHVEYDLNKKFTVDFVPVIILGETHVVAKPHPEFLKNDVPAYEKFWRESFSHKEWDIMARHTGESHKKCLKIAKAIRLNVAQLSMFNSYVFKTVFLHMLDESGPEEWAEETLQDRFIDFFQTFLLYLRKGQLPHHFNPCVNLLEYYDEKAVENAKNFLTRKISKTKLDSLLKMDV